jgi:hypothetical protein
LFIVCILQNKGSCNCSAWLTAMPFGLRSTQAKACDYHVLV